MKKRILLFTIVAGFGYTLLTSYAGGPGLLGQNRTGARLSVTNCGTVGSGCHGTGTSTVVTITVDSAGGVPTTRYVPGMAYTIKIHGTNSSPLPEFGFQYIAVSGTGSAQAQAGTASGFPASVTNHTHFPTGLVMVEHTAGITAPTPGIYDVQFTWTAPSTAVGAITMYCTLNAVTGDNAPDGSDISGNTSVVLTPVVSTTSVAGIDNNKGISAYPNPVTNMLQLQAAGGNCRVSVYDMGGRCIVAEQRMINGAGGTISTAYWAPGMYHVVAETEQGKQVITVIKQ